MSPKYEDLKEKMKECSVDLSHATSLSRILYTSMVFTDDIENNDKISMIEVLSEVLSKVYSTIAKIRYDYFEE